MINTFEVKTYNKVVKLSNVQTDNVINQMCPSFKNKSLLKRILKTPCEVTVDRTKMEGITFYTPFGILVFSKSESQVARLVIMASLTASNYKHFYANLKKKLGVIPIKPSTVESVKKLRKRVRKV